MPRASVATIWVRTARARYPVWVGAGLLRDAGRRPRGGRPRARGLRPRARRLYVISSPRVWRLWGREVARGARAAGLRCETLLMDDREEAKRLVTVERLGEGLLRGGADRGAP